MGTYGIFRKSTNERVGVISASHKTIGKTGDVNLFFGRLTIAIIDSNQYYVTELPSKGGAKGDCKRTR